MFVGLFGFSDSCKEKTVSVSGKSQKPGVASIYLFTIATFLAGILVGSHIFFRTRPVKNENFFQLMETEIDQSIVMLKEAKFIISRKNNLLKEKDQIINKLEKDLETLAENALENLLVLVKDQKESQHEDKIVEIYILLGNIYLELNQKEKAQETYEKGLKLFPENSLLIKCAESVK
ncbi:MAG: tetratricopeptide repeat protein [Planctomycetota bacterium]